MLFHLTIMNFTACLILSLTLASAQDSAKKHPDADKSVSATTIVPEQGVVVSAAHRLLMSSLIDAANRYLQSVQESQEVIRKTACKDAGMAATCFIDWNSGRAFKEAPKPPVTAPAAK